MNYTEPFLRKVETAQEEEQQQHHHPQSWVSYRATVAANNLLFSNLPKLLLFLSCFNFSQELLGIIYSNFEDLFIMLLEGYDYVSYLEFVEFVDGKGCYRGKNESSIRQAYYMYE